MINKRLTKFDLFLFCFPIVMYVCSVRIALVLMRRVVCSNSSEVNHFSFPLDKKVKSHTLIPLGRKRVPVSNDSTVSLNIYNLLVVTIGYNASSPLLYSIAMSMISHHRGYVPTILL